MILSDNETKVDLLNNEAIAKTIVSIIEDSKEHPISIGIHGDWGAGKSSILEMVEDEVESAASNQNKKYICIRFNGWKHQGFEDSKVALMSSIVSELEHKKTLGAKSKDILKKIWKNINWMTISKVAGKTTIGVMTGTTPLALLSSTMDILKSKVESKEGVEDAIESIGAYLSDANITENTSSNKNFSEFQESFAELLDDAKIDKLVVLIDDLDRCLPDVAIHTLEAVRLFLFTSKTAFVIAADESMIRYAVKKHFPDAIDENKFNTGEAFANKYLEKLIQVPFRIPALGEIEACIYIMLLMVGSVLPADNKNYQKLREEGLARIKKPWNVENFTVDNVKEILGIDYEKAEKEVLIATQICHLLAQNTDGNPRKIKRFVNMLLLRYEIAVNRGFGDELELSVLAKMMLAEYYHNSFYIELANHLNTEGKWEDLSDILMEIKCVTEGEEIEKDNNLWFDINKMEDWLLSEPGMVDKDLRPYYYACKEKIDYFSGKSLKEDLTEIIEVLFKDEMTIRTRSEQLESLTALEAVQVFDVVAQKILEKAKFEEKPKGIDGLIVLVQKQIELREKMVCFLDTLPVNRLGVWALSGWEKAVPKGCAERERLDQFFAKLQTQGTDLVQTVAKRMRGDI